MKSEELEVQALLDFTAENQSAEYEKPFIIERTGLEFIEQILQQFQTNELVITCTKCHHCR